MKKNITLTIIVVAILAAAGWYLRESVAPSPSPVESQGSTTPEIQTITAEGTVSQISPAKLVLSVAGSGSETYVLTDTSRLIRSQATTSLSVGSPIVIIYSKVLNKPLSAIVSQPFMNRDTSGTIDLISGKLLSMKGQKIELSTNNATTSFEFDMANPLLVQSNVAPSAVQVGDSVSIQYVPKGEERVIVTALFNR